MYSDPPAESLVGVIIGTVSTGVILLACVVIMFQRGRGKGDAPDAHLTAEEEALIVKKLGQLPKPNNLATHHKSGYAAGHAVTTKPLNNVQTAKSRQPGDLDRRHDAMIKNKLSPKSTNPPSNPHIKIHNNLRSTGTEI